MRMSVNPAVIRNIFLKRRILPISLRHIPDDIDEIRAMPQSSVATAAGNSKRGGGYRNLPIHAGGGVQKTQRPAGRWRYSRQLLILCCDNVFCEPTFNFAQELIAPLRSF